jgi:hypothetical protein
MKKVNNIHDALQEMKKGKGVIFEEREYKNRNKFDISDGNLKVLELIPKMMLNKYYREELRKLAIDFFLREGKT